jgi:hypothetical protein
MIVRAIIPAQSFMGGKQQVLRFAVGSADGPRSRTWRLWVPEGKSDVYASSRRLSSSVKVSMHEPGPSRYVLTSEWVAKTGFEAPEGEDERLAKEWNRPRASEGRAVRPLTLVVPWTEVIERPGIESEEVHWTPAPAKGQAVHFDVVYVPVGMPVAGHPGARSMGTKLVGEVLLANGERVFVTSLVRDMDETALVHIEKLRTFKLLSANGEPIQKTGLLAFGHEPNPDAEDGTEVATIMDVTRPDE